CGQGRRQGQGEASRLRRARQGAALDEDRRSADRRGPRGQAEGRGRAAAAGGGGRGVDASDPLASRLELEACDENGRPRGRPFSCRDAYARKPVRKNVRAAPTPLSSVVPRASNTK